MCLFSVFPSIQEFISESDSKMPNHEDSIQESAKTKSKRKLDHAAKEVHTYIFCDSR